ncbi:hypothetical protein ACP70R_033436 [Stipagrostis hirtigluma subsp. patula]
MDGESSRHNMLESIIQDRSSEPQNLPLEDLRKITDNFSDERLLGEGAFGKVYKGVLLNGDMVAVKKFTSSMPEINERQFENEVRLLMRLKHPNIVQLLGYCSATEHILAPYNGKYVYAEKLEKLLCLEYLPKGSLREHLSGGYRAPEYIHAGLITKKLDIFSLGVIIIEIMTGRKDYAYDTETSSEKLIELVLRNWINRLEKSPGYPSQKSDHYQQIRRCIQIGLACVNLDWKERPTTRQIIEMLCVSEAAECGNKIQVLRRLQQNKEAAWESRLGKKADIQQLETRPMKVARLEQELQRARQQLQGVYARGNLGDSVLGFTGSVDAGVAGFRIEYGKWVDEQNRHTAALSNALHQGQATELELRMLVQTGLNNYEHLFRIKSIAANSDVFYVLSGMWKTPAERFFLWIGGFRPSEVLKILVPHLEPLADEQVVAVYGLQQACVQAEDAVAQGLEKLQQTLEGCYSLRSKGSELTATDSFGSNDAYMLQIANAVGKLEGLEGFVIQADHLRHTTLQQMHKVLTTRQAARALVALGDYFQRLRALSQLWFHGGKVTNTMLKSDRGW